MPKSDPTPKPKVVEEPVAPAEESNSSSVPQDETPTVEAEVEEVAAEEAAQILEETTALEEAEPEAATTFAETKAEEDEEVVPFGLCPEPGCIRDWHEGAGHAYASKPELFL